MLQYRALGQGVFNGELKALTDQLAESRIAFVRVT